MLVIPVSSSPQASEVVADAITNMIEDISRTFLVQTIIIYSGVPPSSTDLALITTDVGLSIGPDPTLIHHGEIAEATAARIKAM